MGGGRGSGSGSSSRVIVAAAVVVAAVVVVVVVVVLAVIVVTVVVAAATVVVVVVVAVVVVAAVVAFVCSNAKRLFLTLIYDALSHFFSLVCCEFPLHCARVRPDSPHKRTTAAYQTGKDIPGRLSVTCLFSSKYTNLKIAKNKL